MARDLGVKVTQNGKDIVLSVGLSHTVDFKAVGSCSHTSLGQPKSEKPI